MAKYYDEEIDKNIDWGGDESTGGLPVKGNRVQEFIKKELNKKPSKLTLQKGTESEEVETDSNGNMTLNIPTVEVDSTLIDSSTNPVSGGAVKAELDRIGSKFGASVRLNTIESGDGKAYSISLLDENGEELNTTDQFSGGGSGTIQTTKIVLTRLSESSTVKKGDTVKLSYQYDQIDTTTEESTGNAATVTTTVTYGANSYTETKTVPAGSTQEIDVTSYLGVGSNTVRVRAVVGEGAEQQVASITWNITVVELVLSSSFNIATVTNRGTNVSIPYSLSGAGSKTLRCYVDGEDIDDRSITASTSNGSFSLDTSKMSHGSHSVQMVVELELAGGKVIKSNSIYFDIAIKESGNSTPIVVSRFDFSDGDIISSGSRPYISTRQFEFYTLIYSVYDPSVTPTLVKVYEGDKVISDTNISFTTQSLSVRAQNEGEIESKIVTRDGKEYTYSVKVQKSSVDVTEPTDNLQLKLSAEGRSNNDLDKESWTYNDITTEFSGFKWGGDGWMTNALHLTDKAKAVVKYQPFKQSEDANNAFAFFIKFKVTEVVDDSAQVIKCLDADGTGFVITSQEAMIQTRGKSQVSMKLASGNVYEIAFVSFPKSSDFSSDYEKQNTQMVYLYINGIMSGGVQRADTDSIYQGEPSYVELGAEGATIDVYSIRAYNSYLSDSQVLDCYLIGLDTVDELIQKYNENNVIDDNGNVTVDNVPDGMRYVIVTGQQENGVATVLQAAVNNDKDPKYDVDEILCIKKGTPELNFRLIGGCIRLQGTSSLQYPIKNYRIYLKNSNKVAGELYLGCNEQGVGGEKQEKVKYSFRLASSSQKKAAPVDCWCLKADFAESSSSHNTGLAKLAQNVLTSANELTPAQKHVSEEYEYDVRTTVDGEPCYLFYRRTLEETPIFLGKFNWNNDKSTEDVFGFLDIPGYHDQAWVNDVFGGENPTECWEFLSNDYPMGMFLDDDFDTKGSDGTPNWMKVFEARFPDDDDRNAQFEAGTLKPTYLEQTVKWVKSTENNGAKFKAELANYFDVNYLCDYYMFTEIFGCVDQRVKNMMLGFWYKEEAYTPEDPMKGMRGYFIFYDNDTIMGVRNDGRLKYNWDVNENTIDTEKTTPEKTVYAYAGHDSILWENLREQFPDKLQAAYKRIRDKMSNDTIFNMFDKEQSAKFCERIYNLDAINKYVIPKTIGVSVVQDGKESNVTYSYMEAMQGSRQSHRRWWVTNRMGLLDARYSTGTFYSDPIKFKGSTPAGVKISATPARDFYFEFEGDGNTLIHSAVTTDIEWSYTYNQAAEIGTIFNLYGGTWMKKLNLSEWGGFSDLSFPTLPVLEELILGISSKTYTLSEFIIESKLPMLRTLEMVNYVNLPSVNLSGCTRLQSVNLSGCTSMSTASFAEGAPLENLTLPANFQTLILKSMQYLTKENIVFENKNNLQGLWIENCAKIDGYSFFKEIFALKGKLKYVRVTGLNLSGNGSDLTEFYDAKLGGITATGNTTTTSCKLVGTYQLTEYLDDTLYDKYVEYFDELNILQPKWTAIEFEDDEPDPANISNLDNETGYKFDKPYEPSGHIKKILSLRHRVLSKHKDGMMYYYPLHDKNSNKYADAEDVKNCTSAVLTGEEGDVDMYEPHYWYKGVNDELGVLYGDGKSKKWAFYSTYENAPKENSDMLVINTDDLIQSMSGITKNQYIKSSVKVGDTASSIFTSSSDYFTLSINIPEDYQDNGLIRMPAEYLYNVATGLVFIGEDNTVLKALDLSKYWGLQVGGYLILNIPLGAKKIITSLTSHFDSLIEANGSTLNRPDIILGFSKNPEDWENKAVEHNEYLLSSFDAQNIDGKLKSVFKDSRETKTSYDSDLLLSLPKQRNRSPFYAKYLSDINNLFLAKYGTRDSQGVFGIYLGGTLSLGGYGFNGQSAEYGIQDTFRDKSGLYNDEVFIYSNDGEKVSVSFLNIMGHENLWMGEASNSTIFVYIKQLSTESTYSCINDDRFKVIGAYSGTYYGSVSINGRFSIALPNVVSGVSHIGSTSSYFCDQTTLGGGNSAKMLGIRRDWTRQDAYGVFGILATSNGLGVTKLSYEGPLTKCSTVAEFKQIQDFD